jgi:hypothetical protein
MCVDVVDKLLEPLQRHEKEVGFAWLCPYARPDDPYNMWCRLVWLYSDLGYLDFSSVTQTSMVLRWKTAGVETRAMVAQARYGRLFFFVRGVDVDGCANTEEFLARLYWSFRQLLDAVYPGLRDYRRSGGEGLYVWCPMCQNATQLEGRMLKKALSSEKCELSCQMYCEKTPLAAVQVLARTPADLLQLAMKTESSEQVWRVLSRLVDTSASVGRGVASRHSSSKLSRVWLPVPGDFARMEFANLTWVAVREDPRRWHIVQGMQVQEGTVQLCPEAFRVVVDECLVHVINAMTVGSKGLGTAWLENLLQWMQAVSCSPGRGKVSTGVAFVDWADFCHSLQEVEVMFLALGAEASTRTGLITNPIPHSLLEVADV